MLAKRSKLNEMENKLIRTLFAVVSIIAFGLSVLYMFRSYKTMGEDSEIFRVNSSLLSSYLTSLIILLFVLRNQFSKNNLRAGILFSKAALISILVYYTFALEILTYNLIYFSFFKSAFALEKIISLFFVLLCAGLLVYMIRGKDLKVIEPN